jgi:hypothetical protein
VDHTILLVGAQQAEDHENNKQNQVPERTPDAWILKMAMRPEIYDPRPPRESRRVIEIHMILYFGYMVDQMKEQTKINKACAFVIWNFESWKQHFGFPHVVY